MGLIFYLFPQSLSLRCLIYTISRRSLLLVLSPIHLIYTITRRSLLLVLSHIHLIYTISRRFLVLLLSHIHLTYTISRRFLLLLLSSPSIYQCAESLSITLLSLQPQIAQIRFEESTVRMASDCFVMLVGLDWVVLRANNYIIVNVKILKKVVDFPVWDLG